MNQRTWKLPLPLLSIFVGMFVFAFFFLSGSVVEAACGTLDPDTADFYYPMEATSEANAGTGGALVGVYDNGITTDATPIANNSEGGANRMAFVGASDQQIRFTTTGTAFNGPFTDVTYEFWFDVNGVVGRQQLFEVGSATRGLGIYLDGTDIYAGMWEGNTIGTDAVFATIAGAITADTAYHVIVVKDGDTITLNINSNAGGTQSASATRGDADGTIASMGSAATIGDAFGGNTLDHTGGVVNDGTAQMDGSIDDFAVYIGTAATAGEVTAAFAGCTPTAVTMSGIATNAANSLPYIAIAVLVLGTATVVILRRERVLN